ncbi:peptidase M50 [Gemmatimonadetes bacterium T265]|nr:peptidase M50 [Gemmatimonadetes bacterium T265]
MDLTTILLGAPVLLFSFVAHEYAHVYAALRQGDPTGYQLGRLTWNPLPHIDPFFSIVLPLMSLYFGNFIFGGAKPAPVVPRNFRHYKRGDIIVSLAGVTANVAIGVVCGLLALLFGMLGAAVPAAGTTCAILQQMALFGLVINFTLAAFNLLPIPPLDGSHVAKYLLPPAWAQQYERIGQYGFLVLFLFLSFGRGLLVTWMTPAFAAIATAERALAPYLLPTPWH